MKQSDNSPLTSIRHDFTNTHTHAPYIPQSTIYTCRLWLRLIKQITVFVDFVFINYSGSYRTIFLFRLSHANYYFMLRFICERPHSV